MGREYTLPDELRAQLSRPIGTLYTGEEIGSGKFLRAITVSSMLITVGDRVTETMGALGRVPDVQIIYGKENRKARLPPNVPHARAIEVRNPAGTITAEAISGIKEALAGVKPARVIVDGEEDLLAIPAIALAPLGSNVLYGQPGEGIVLAVADGGAKERSRALLGQMGVPELT